MASSTYAQAREQLSQVLSSGLFHKPRQRPPWWSVAWHWLQQHVHVSARLIPWATVARLCEILAAAIVCLVIWRLILSLLRRSGAVSVRKDRSPRTLSLWIERAAESYRRGDYAQMLADLINACVRFAADRRWWLYRTSETSRRYQALVKELPNPAFQALFTDLVRVAEQVRYAGGHLDDEAAASWLKRVKSISQEVES